MDAITHRLDQLREHELALLSDRTAIVARRDEEDRNIRIKRAEEDEAWKKQLEARDREEDNLLARKRELSRQSMLGNLAASLPDPAVSPLGNRDDEGKSGKFTKAGKLRKRYIVNNGYPHGADAAGPLFLRPSDNRLVHLHCCVIGCPKQFFTTVTSLMTHIASSRASGHGLGKGFLKNHADAIEKCGRLPIGEDGQHFLQIQPQFGEAEASDSKKLPVRIPNSSLTRVSVGNLFSNLHDGNNGYPGSETEGCDNEDSEQATAYCTGIGTLKLSDEAELEYVGMADGEVILEDPSDHGNTPNNTSDNVEPDSTLEGLQGLLFGNLQREIRNYGADQAVTRDTAIKEELVDNELQLRVADSEQPPVSQAEASEDIAFGDPTSRLTITLEKDVFPSKGKRVMSYPLESPPQKRMQRRTKRCDG